MMKKKFLSYVFLMSVTLGIAQSITVTGIVTDESSQPLPGVSVLELNTSNGVVTDFDGSYTLLVSSEEAIVVFSYLGFNTKEITVSKQSNINVLLEEDLTNLDEVVVTALGVLSKKKSLGYATTNIGGSELTKSQETNPVNALAGKVSGLQITQSAAGMGGSSKVLLRGNSSLGGNNQPLYVVDGIPIDNRGFGGASTGGSAVASDRSDYGTGVSDVNPNDIESISVLKGPNAAALYGNRAANGVIIITTKKSKAQRGIGVSYSASFMASSVNDNTLPDFQNQYGMGSAGSFANDAVYNSWGAKFDDTTFTYPSGLESVYSAQPNNVRDFFNTGFERTHNISVEGGSEKASVRFSYTNLKGEGIIPDTELDKNTFNLRANTKLTDKLSIDSKVTYFTQKGNNRPSNGWTGRNPLNHVYRWNRNALANDYKNNQTDDLGQQIDPYFNPGVVNDNPYYIQSKRTNEDFRNRVLGFVKATYTFNETFSAFARIGTDVLSQKIRYIIPWGGDARQPEGSISDEQYGSTETNADLLLMYNNQLSEDFNLNFNLGGSYRFNSDKFSTRGGRDFKIPGAPATYANLKVINAGTESPTNGFRSSIYSAYFSGTLDYKEMVYLNFTGRNDWDSKLWTQSSTGNEWSFFYPSVSLSLLGNDLLGIDNSILSFSKLRIAWAKVGSGGDKNDRTRYFLSSNTGYNGLVTLTKDITFSDPNLRPEETISNELGLELKFFNNRLYTDFTYYDSTTSDQIINAPIDPSSGFQFIRTNVGKITNKGFEFLIGGTPIQTDSFSWDTSVNFSKNESVLESFVDGVDAFVFTGRDNFSVKTKVGGNYGDLWGNNFTYDANGKMIVGANGLPIASTEEEKLGNYYPDFMGGFNNTFRYKNLSLNVLVDFRIGGEAIDWTSRELSEKGLITSTLEGREGMVLDAVTESGAVNTAEITSQDYWTSVLAIPGAHLQDLSNVRLREASLSYKLPSNILDKMFISRASISLIGRNLFFISKKADGVDPESSVSVGNQGQGIFYYNAPSARRIGMGLNLSF